MITEYTHEDCNFSVSPVLELALMLGDLCFIILIDVMITLMVFGDCSSVSAKRQHLRYIVNADCPKDCTRTSERRCGYCSCGVRAVHKLT